MTSSVAAFAATVLLATTVAAAPPGSRFTYFNRPGATRAMHNEDVRACFTIALPITAPHYVGGAGDIINTGIALDILNDIQSNAIARANVESCMLVRGWRAVGVPDAEGAALADLKRPALEERLSGWIGQVSPYGTVLRQFGDGKEPDGGKSLSLAALDTTDMRRDGTFKQEGANGKEAKTQIKPLGANEIRKIAPGEVILVVELRAHRKDGYQGVGFTRLADSLRDAPSDKPGAATVPWFLTPFPKQVFKGSDAKGAVTAIYVAPAGLWALSNARFHSSCLMAPAFEAKAGDVLYLGAFDLDDPRHTDMDLTAARAALVARSLPAEKLRPAPWINGLTWTCRTIFVGGYAINGAPYLSGFPWRPLEGTAETP